ncbi:MAG: orotidine-5'-phosphate decarboxylase [Christensenellales bacterium]|jgi:orotidine-5'-phosphate decarboxylase
MNIMDALANAITKKQNPTAVGLDTRVEYLPEGFFNPGADFQKSAGEAIFDFNRALIDAVADIVPAVKVQVAFYEMYGLEGMKAFLRTLNYAKQAGLIVIADVKRGDIGSTAEAYAHAFLSGTPAGEKSQPAFAADIVTVNPYLGTDGIKPFADACAKCGKGIFVLVKTSNPSGGEIQDLIADGRPIYEHVGLMTARWGEELIGKSGYSAVGAVVGATYPEQGARLRSLLPNTFFLIPGYGAQGGTAEGIAKSFDPKGGGAIVNASRSIMCAYRKQPGVHFADAARNEALRMKDDLLSALGDRIG